MQANPPRRFAFTIRTLLLLTGAVALFFGLRIGYVFHDMTDGPTVIRRGECVCRLFAGLAALYCCVLGQLHRIPKRRSIVVAVMFGATTALLCAAAIGIEFAEAFRKVYPEYWQWHRDWPIFARDVILRQTLVGGFIALVIVTLWIAGAAAFRRCFRQPPVGNDAK